MKARRPGRRFDSRADPGLACSSRYASRRRPFCEPPAPPCARSTPSPSLVEIAHLRNLLETAGYRVPHPQRPPRRRGGGDPVRRVLARALVAAPGRRAARAGRDRPRAATGAGAGSLDLPAAAASASKGSSTSCWNCGADAAGRRPRHDDADHRAPLQRAAGFRQRRLRLRLDRGGAAGGPARAADGAAAARDAAAAGRAMATVPGGSNPRPDGREGRAAAAHALRARAAAYVHAVWASQHYAGFRDHPFPDCFVCGPQRRRGDGLGSFPAMLDTGLVAAPWLPGRFARCRRRQGGGALPLGGARLPGLLCGVGRATGDAAGRDAGASGSTRSHRRIPVRVIGWRIGAEGRKHYVGTAIFDEEGELCARASATWIAVPIASA